MTQVPVLETERLIMREFKPSDFEAFAEFYASDASQFVGGPWDRITSWRELSTYAGCWSLRGFGEFSLEHKETGKTAGLVGPWYPDGWPEPEIGWIIFPEFQRQGLGAEAANRAVKFAYQDLGWTTAISCIDKDNIASIKLAEKLGAKFEGDTEIKPFGMTGLYRHLPPQEHARVCNYVQ